MLSETWLRAENNHEKLEEELSKGQNIGWIMKNRGRRRGGGVAIAFDENKCPMKRISLPNLKKFEVTGAITEKKYGGKKLVALAAYVPPAMKAQDRVELVNKLGEEVARMKLKFDTPHLVLGGDFNKLDVTGFFCDCPEMSTCTTGPTRGTHTLDLLITNFGEQITEAAVLGSPLETEEGAA